MPASHPQTDRRRSGNAVIGVIAVLLLLALALGGNYVRNYQTDQQDEQKARPYSRYRLADLEVLAEGYRSEIDTAEGRRGGGRVTTRNRHHFSDQIQEFERVQQAARKSRDKAVEIAQLRGDLQAIEEEIELRRGQAGAVGVHLERMFRL